MLRIAALIIALTCMLGASVRLTAQENLSQPPTTEEEQKKAQAENARKGLALLEQLVEEAQSLRLPENRIRVEITAGDLLWESNEGRARSLFSLAADALAELIRNSYPIDPRRNADQRGTTSLRQELVLTAARRDAQLAYQLLAATRRSTPVADNTNPRRVNAEENLEQELLARVAALDPKLALQNAVQMLDKGQYPRSLTSVLAQLQRKDKEAAVKLEDKLLKRLQSENLFTNTEASSLTVSLLIPGPRPSGNATESPVNNSSQLLGQSSYTILMETLVDAALKMNSANATPNQRQPNSNRGRVTVRGALNSSGTGPTEVQIEQNNARRLLGGLQMLLPQIDQYLPARAQALRQKLSESGMVDNQRTAMNQVFSALQQGNADNLMAAAAVAPGQVQSRLYRQAALKALDEGNPDRARQIANDHLDANSRASILQMIDFKQISQKADAGSLEEVRQTLSRLSSDNERIELLLQLAGVAQQNNPKLALQLLDEASQLANRRATNYDQLNQQLRVAHAFMAVAPERSFEVLEPGIMQLNELLSAASVLNGFEVNVFRDGELPLQGGSALGSMVARYGEELAVLAKRDFESAQTLANRFQSPEPRIMARLSIARGLLGLTPLQQDRAFGFRRFGSNTNFMRPPQ